ncbi:EDEM2 [Symbiodinium sp. CCMP2456]|nr:EDEM2 [Symbiodinium sp. CCMP2456]
MPRSRVNLAKGIPKGSSATVTIAEAGSFLLEFGMLSHLTGEDRFYRAAKRSLLAFWGRRNLLDLVGTSIDVNTGNFVDQQSTTGPGQDSFYEYLLKGYILFHDFELLEIFLSAYASVELYHSFEGFTYNVDMNKGLMANTHLSPLACVWASLQVLVGDVASGLRSVLYWYGLWKKHEALPEVFDTRAESPTQARDSPLRPELIEAIFYLSLALPGDSMIFDMAKNIATAINDQSRVDCGFASVADVTTKRLDDRMDSFFLSETLVYLYLSLAPPEDLANAMPWPVGASIFTTEGHLFPIFPKAADSRVSATTTARSQDLYPASALDSPQPTCEALTPFERVAVQQRCRTKYLLTPSYQMQMNAEASRRCRSQAVQLLVWSAGDFAKPVMHVSGLASSLGRAVPVLPLLHAQLQEDGAETAIQAGDGHGHQPPLQHTLALLRLDLEQSPGRMPYFSSSPFRFEPLRRLFATREIVAMENLRLQQLAALQAAMISDMKQELTRTGDTADVLNTTRETSNRSTTCDLDPDVPSLLNRKMEPMKLATPETLSPRSSAGGSPTISCKTSPAWSCGSMLSCKVSAPPGLELLEVSAPPGLENALSSPPTPSCPDSDKEADHQKGLLVATTTTLGSSVTQVTWHIANPQAKLRVSCGSALVSPPFAAGGLEGLRLLFSPGERWLVDWKKAAKKALKKGKKAVDRAPQYGALQLKFAGDFACSEPMTLLFNLAGEQLGPITANPGQSTCFVCELRKDWRLETNGLDGSLTVGVDIVSHGHGALR